MSMIDVQDLTFGYEGSFDNVFENVSFRIDTNWKLGFVGRNGRGKTTFMKLLLGEYEYNGRIISDIGFEYFPFEVKNIEYLVRDIADEVCPNAEDWELIKEFSLLDMGADILYRQYCTLSGGEKTKVLLAMLFLKDEKFLLIDEPTNHLDTNGRRAVSRYLKSKKSFILVSHDRAVLDECVDHVLSINRANIEIESGNYSSWEHNKQARDNFEMTNNERLSREIKQLEAAAKKAHDHSQKIESTKIGFDPIKEDKLKSRRTTIAQKARKLMDRSKAMETRTQRAADEKRGLLKNIEKTSPLKLTHPVYHSNTLLSLTDVTVSYDGRQVCEPVTFAINRGERVVLEGVNGCGKSSILKLITGQPIEHTGLLNVGSGLKISYVSQDTTDLKGSLTDYAQSLDIDESLLKAILRKTDFSREQFDLDISEFSEGQKKKVLIAGSLCEKAHLYIWDEPLNYIDIFSRMQIEQLIKDFSPTMILVEHDEAFRRETAARAVSVIPHEDK